MTSKRPLTPRTCHVNFAPLSLPVCRPISKEEEKGKKEGRRAAKRWEGRAAVKLFKFFGRHWNELTEFPVLCELGYSFTLRAPQIVSLLEYSLTLWAPFIWNCNFCHWEDGRRIRPSHISEIDRRLSSIPPLPRPKTSQIIHIFIPFLPSLPYDTWQEEGAKNNLANIFNKSKVKHFWYSFFMVGLLAENHYFENYHFIEISP